MNDEEIAILKASGDRLWRKLKRIDDIYSIALIDWSKEFIKLKDENEARASRLNRRRGRKATGGDHRHAEPLIRLGDGGSPI